MTKKPGKNPVPRRDFLKLAAAGSAVAVLGAYLPSAMAAGPEDEKPATNGKDSLKYPRTNNSMPGYFPGRVAEVINENVMVDGKPVQQLVYDMLAVAMLSLTSIGDSKQLQNPQMLPNLLTRAWRMFFSDKDIIGIKVNPVNGMELSTTTELVLALVRQLEDAGIPRRNLVIWDRREFQLAEAGFTQEAFPGIKLTGTECKDEQGSFVNAEGKFYSEERIDKDWYYRADVEEEYDAETLPYMVNSGKYSYFSKICTQEVDKIINIPVLKNAGSSVSMALKNLAYGSITNTGRLHKQLWSETCAEVCAFPPLRDKVVLNLVDGLRGCFNGGPGANPQFIRNFNTLLLATDPVAVDRVGYDIILKTRIAEGVQKEESPRGRKFMELASELKLGIADLEKISRETIRLS